MAWSIYDLVSPDEDPVAAMWRNLAQNPSQPGDSPGQDAGRGADAATDWFSKGGATTGDALSTAITAPANGSDPTPLVVPSAPPARNAPDPATTPPVLATPRPASAPAQGTGPAPAPAGLSAPQLPGEPLIRKDEEYPYPDKLPFGVPQTFRAPDPAAPVEDSKGRKVTLFLYGKNPNASDPDFFRRHAKAQADSFNLEHSPIIGYKTLPAPHSPSPMMAVRGEPSEIGYVLPATNTDEFNQALRSHPNISRVVWNGHAWNLGQSEIDLPALDRKNLAPGATMELNGCQTGVDSNGSGTFSAERYANHFGVPTRGVVDFLSFGMPVPFYSGNHYFDLAPGTLRRSGSFTGEQPQFKWVQPRKP